MPGDTGADFPLVWFPGPQKTTSFFLEKHMEPQVYFWKTTSNHKFIFGKPHGTTIFPLKASLSVHHQQKMPDRHSLGCNLVAVKTHAATESEPTTRPECGLWGGSWTVMARPQETKLCAVISNHDAAGKC